MLGTTRAALCTVGGPALDRRDRAAAAALVARRAAREPLQHLTGVAGFRYLDLAVGPGVFVPRPETELLAGEAIDELTRLVAVGRRAPRWPSTSAPAPARSRRHWHSEVPQARGHRGRGRRAGPRLRRAQRGPVGVDVRLGDMADAVDDLAGRVHVVTANPPYIPLEAFESVEPEARDHDPAVALWSGQDGLDAIRVVAEVAARLLVDGGLRALRARRRPARVRAGRVLRVHRPGTRCATIATWPAGRGS